jgi:hypothetical protein
MTKAFFRRDGDLIVGNDGARGPWSEDACHAGPVAAVLAGAAEATVCDKQLARLTATFFRPLPMSGFSASTALLHDGRMSATVRVELKDSDMRVCASADCLFQATQANQLPTATISHPIFDESTPGKFPIQDVRHDKPFFGQLVELRYPPGEDGSPGPTTLWMRTPPIIDSEATSAFQSLCPLADCGNGTSRNVELSDASCINPDLTIAIFRLPESDWLASQAISYWQPNGIGMSHAMLFDKVGPIGAALQTLLIRDHE